MSTYICVYFGALVFALLTTPAVIWLAGRIGALDRPGVRTVHQHPVPRIGGVAIFLSAMSLITLTVFLHKGVGDAFLALRVPSVALLGSAAVVFVLGLVDDLRELPARTKLLVELPITAVLCLAGIRIPGIALTGEQMLPLGGLGYALTILWTIGITNAVNLSDGLDGLAAGVGSIACGAIALYAFQSGNIIVGVFMLALLGSLSGFLVFNFHPAKVFMGDCGSLFLGFMIAVSSVMCMMHGSALVGLALPALALGIPIFDTLCAMLRRFLERRSLFAPDRCHFHHRLLELGLNQRRAVLVVYVVTLLTTSLGVFMWVCDGISSVIPFGGALLLIVLVFRAVGVVPLRDILARLQQRYQSSCRERQERKVFEDRQLQFRQIHNASQWWQAVCQTAKQMDFAWVSLVTTYEDGRIEENLWEILGTNCDMSRIITVAIPLRNGHTGASHQLEIAIHTDNSVESASRRATLFGRLVDECEAQAWIPDQTWGAMGAGGRWETAHAARSPVLSTESCSERRPGAPDPGNRRP